MQPTSSPSPSIAVDQHVEPSTREENAQTPPVPSPSSSSNSAGSTTTNTTTKTRGTKRKYSPVDDSVGHTYGLSDSNDEHDGQVEDEQTVQDERAAETLGADARPVPRSAPTQSTPLTPADSPSAQPPADQTSPLSAPVSPRLTSTTPGTASAATYLESPQEVSGDEALSPAQSTSLPSSPRSPKRTKISPQ